MVTASHHVNVGIEDPDALFRAYRVLRSEASMFLALTAASPFLGGEITGFHSSRWGLFPKTPRSVPFFAGHDEFTRLGRSAARGRHHVQPAPPVDRGAAER